MLLLSANKEPYDDLFGDGVLLCCTDGLRLPESKVIFLLQPSWKLRLYAHGHTSSLLTIFSGCIVVQESIAEGSEGNCPTLSTLLSSRVLPGFLLRD